MFSNVLHELSHIIDFSSGYQLLGLSDKNLVGFSDSDEFKAIYNTYFKDKVVEEYTRDNNMEAFADSLGEYIKLRILVSNLNAILIVLIKMEKSIRLS